MRIVVDANILISYALAPDSSSAIVQVVEAIWSAPVQLILPDLLIDEIRSTVARKPQLRDRIPAEDLDELLRELQAVAVPFHQDQVEIVAVLRDRKDDVLLDAAIRANADYLISGDRDLLDISDQLEHPRIVSAREFLDLLDQMAG